MVPRIEPASLPPAPVLAAPRLTDARATWRDWQRRLRPDLPEPASEDLLTRDELLAAARDRGADVSARRLMDWEAEGVLPRPTTFSPPGSRGRTARYAPWQILLTALVPVLQRHGWRLDQIAEATRRVAPTLMPYHDLSGVLRRDDPAWLNAVVAAFAEPVRQAAQAMAQQYNELRLPGAPPVTHALVELYAGDEPVGIRLPLQTDFTETD